MAKARAIVKRLKAVKNIRKITRTMELIATARFKKAMDRAAEAAAYTRKISELVADLSQANLEFHHPLLEKHETEKNSVLLVLTSNRGLCGGYNTGVLKLALKRYQELQSEGQNVRLEVSGKRGISFLKFQGVTADNSYTHFEDRPTFEEVDDLASRYITEYIEGKIDRLDVAYTEFISSSRQAAVVHSLLPIGALETSETDSDEQYDYEFLPSAQEILEEIVPTAFKARLFKCFLDAAVSEQIARMVAMKGATENANEMVGTLSAQYNRARQTQITSEILEIIGGAAALE
ncbi:ATP synthase F1 subunit gamma [Gimesia chilikensis]|jgi:F-type H+-transporting ATPase subunit gamma|uniref:ATP synthase gamma chain n=1 Tax=Gimesia chilikensis TaxID=2605989 RepID=A0A517PPJ6_9PLAN|nr:ATP synthase F1 subunit gamma [Gimesia chilikensis]MBN73521.1 ATP synthase F1 subunit gamma [Gimesia sp.]MCR9233747.1 ATP synthase F1 subunit gamma [bacterium]QDT21290.1 ATP synthase gamma chain [Gimesia chilikensis]QDT84266.1 ATP synthase gamma chain [Gimesia chilikensis]